MRHIGKGIKSLQPIARGEEVAGGEHHNLVSMLGVEGVPNDPTAQQAWASQSIGELQLVLVWLYKDFEKIFVKS